MTKAGYFLIAVVVAFIAITGYFIVHRQDTIKEGNEDTKQEEMKVDVPADFPGRQDKDKTKTPNQNYEVKQEETVKKIKIESPRSKEDVEVSQSLPTPPRHLKKLGEHGSPVLTGEFEELDYVLGGKDFYAHFMRKRRPVVLRGAARNWPAFHHWPNKTYLIENYGQELFTVEYTKKYENAPPIKKTLTMEEFLGIYEKNEVYLDSPFPQSPMIQDIQLPACLQCKELSSSVSSIHLLYSNGGTSSNFHYDGKENLLSLLSGTKEVLLAHYNDSKYFSDDGKLFASVVSPIDPEAVDLIRFPQLINITFYKITLHAGDILYIPEGWWHHVRSYDSPNIAISLWFGIFRETVDPDAEQEQEQEESVSAIKRLKAFGEAVNNAPETIECKSQNRPISEVYWPKDNPDIPKLEDPDQWVVTLNTGYKMPRKGFGTAFLNDTKAAILIALKAGFRLIDSAQAYMYNDTAVGSALKESGIPREEVFLVSKLLPKYMRYDDTINSVKETLEKMQISYIDLMLIHVPECDPEEEGFTCGEGETRGTWKDSWRGLEFLVNDGKIRSIGVSNFEIHLLKELKELAKIQPAVVQNFFTPFYHDKEVRKFCNENNIQYMGFSTLGSQYLEDYGFKNNPILNDEGIKAIALAFDASPAQVVLKWALENDVIALSRSSNPNRIHTNFNLHHVYLRDSDHKYFESLDGKLEDDNSNTEDKQEQQEQQTTRKPPVRNKEIIDKLVLEKKVNPDDATLYVSSDDQWIYAIDAKTGNLMWKYGTAEDGGSRCVFSPDESVVYCATDDQSIRAFNRLDGTLLWKFKTNGAVTSSTRVGTDGTLYVGCLDGFMYSIKPDGSLKWKANLGEQIWSSPALKDGGRVVYVGAMVDSPANVFALNGDTGETIWSYKTGGPVFSSPALSQDEKVMYICSFDGHCYAFDSDNGKILWTFEGDNAFQSSPVLSHSHDQMYVASAGGVVHAVNMRDGSQVWKYQSKGDFFSSPFPSNNGNVYIGSGNGEVLAMSQSEGKLIWSFKTETTDMVYSSPRMTNDGVLYIGGVDGYLYALKPETGELVWKFKTNGPLVGTVRIPKQHNEPQS